MNHAQKPNQLLPIALSSYIVSVHAIRSTKSKCSSSKKIMSKYCAQSGKVLPRRHRVRIKFIKVECSYR